MQSTSYDSAFFNRQLQDRSGPREVVPVLVDLLAPRRVVDVGCGIGLWLDAFRVAGVEDVTGVDGDYVERSRLLIPADRFVACDLTSGLPLKDRYDLVISLEVAEHLPGEHADAFVRSLVGLGKVVLFSAAIPGQGGTNHVNEQWPEYWQAKFAAHGYVVVDCLRRRFWSNEAVPIWYRQNMFLYVEQEFLNGHPGLRREKDAAGSFPLSAVHPVYFQLARKRLTPFQLIRSLPKIIRRAVSRAWGR